MSRKVARPKGSGRTGSRFRDWKIIAITAGATAAIAVAVLLAFAGSPGGDVVARVNGHRITAEHVEAMQIRHELYYGEAIASKQALERIISDKLVYREAEEKGYVLDREQAEQELHAQLESEGWTMEGFRDQLEQYGILYDEYLETFRRELAIEQYLEAAIQVTEEEAMERHEELAEIPDVLLPPFELIKEEIIAEMRLEKLVQLLHSLRQEADIRYTNSG